MTLPSGGFEPTVVIGVERASLLGNAWNMVQGRSAAIQQTDGIIVDACDNEKLEHPAIGELREIGGRRARIVAKSQGITGFLVAPYVFTTYERAASFLGIKPDWCSYFLVQIAPGADSHAVCERIRHVLPDVEVFPKDLYSRVSINFWMTRTGLGISFGAATLLGLFVGLVMVAETLYALVLDRLSEFGTLKAIGANEGQVFHILLTQALIMAVAGSVLGLAAVALIQNGSSTPRAPILVPWWLSFGSVASRSVLCFNAFT
ncbi:MAG: ABC transporter permease [Pirellulaceae bacterium]